MWMCPKCGRKFRNPNQAHFCGDKPKTIDEYILSQDVDKREALTRVRAILSVALPDAEERISWSMPTFWKGYNILHFAASQNHVGLYPRPEAVAHFSHELADYKTNKGTIQIPYDKINNNLIQMIAVWCRETGNHA